MGSRFWLALISALIAVVSAVWAAEGSAAPSSWLVRTWLTEHGLPQNSVNAVLQTRDGFLWVGTNAGLARFDGVRFRTFGLPEGLRSVVVLALAEDRDGALWIGTSGGGVSCWKSGRITSFGADEGFPAGTDVIALAADRDGSLWIGTEKGLVQRSNGAFKIIGDEHGVPRKQIRALAVDTRGTVWASALPEGIFRGTNGRFARVEGGPDSIYSLMEDRDGSMWAGGNDGVLWRWREETWKRFDPESGLPKSNIQSIAQSKDGALWIGTRNAGLYRSAGDRFARATNDGELSAETIRAVTVDCNGSIWVGAVGGGGLNRLSPRVLEYHVANAGLPQTSVTSVAEDAAGSLWAGTANKGVQRFDAGRFSQLEDPAVAGGFPYVYCTTTTSDGSVWAAGEQALYRFRPGQPTQAFLEKPIRGEAIRALCADGETLWVGTYYSTLIKCDAAGVQVVAPPHSFPGGITSIVREAADTLWIGTSDGLHRWERGQIRTWTTRDGLLTASIRALHRDADGTLWLGTLGGGLARMKDGRFAHITTRNGLIDNVISQIVPDDSGHLWLGCNRGLMRLDRRDLDALADGKSGEVHPIVFGRNEGMLHEQCAGGHSPTALKTKDGRLLFPTASGITEIDPRRLQDRPDIAPSAVIESILVNDQPQALDAPLVLPPGKHRLEISYGAPALRGGEWVRYRYQLEGLERAWVTDAGKRTVAYGGLRPGSYVFHVAASDGGGNWSAPGASLAITVRPLFSQTLPFRIAVALLAIGINGAAVWWLMALKHRRESAEIERERKHHAELAHAGRVALLGELSASLAHELKQPLTAILSNAQAAQRFLDNDATDVSEVREILKDIVASDRRASEIISHMRAMFQKGDPQMEPRDLNADIEQVIELIHSDLVARGCTVETKFARDLPLIRGDHIQLQQVVLNLVINGCDAMRAVPSDDRRVFIETAHDGAGLVRVSVADRGTGILPEMLEEIFEPFYSTKETGLGMGLAICQAVIKAHGGRLRATNNPERGATFHFTLLIGDEKQP